MKKIRQLIADAVFYSGHYGNKFSTKLIELGMDLHIKLDTETGKKIIKLRSQIDTMVQKELNKNKPKGELNVRGNVFIKAKRGPANN